MSSNLSNTTTYFQLTHSNELPVLIRKIHLGKCLESGNWEAIRKDLNERSIDEVDGNSSEEDILEVLNYYGVYSIQSASGAELTFITFWGSESEDSVQAREDDNPSKVSRMSIMEVANMIKEVIGYKGFFRYNKPEDAMSKLKWMKSEELVEGIAKVYQLYLNQ